MNNTLEQLAAISEVLSDIGQDFNKDHGKVIMFFAAYPDDEEEQDEEKSQASVIASVIGHNCCVIKVLLKLFESNIAFRETVRQALTINDFNNAQQN